MKESWGRCGMGGGNKEQTPTSRPRHWGMLWLLPLGDAWGGPFAPSLSIREGSVSFGCWEGVVFVLVYGRSDASASSLLVHPPWDPQGVKGCLCPEQDPSTETRWAGDKGGKKGLFWGGKCPPPWTPSLMSKGSLAVEAWHQVTGAVLRAGGAACALGMGQREGRAQAACGHPLPCPPPAVGWVGGSRHRVPRGFCLLFQSKLVKYFSRQLSCKRKVALQERNAKLEGFPQLLHWFRIVNIRKEVMEVRARHRPHRSGKGSAVGLGAKPLQ